MEPYSTRKQTDNVVTEDLGDADAKRLICEKCTNCVDNIIQCERWYCSKCTGLPSLVMDIIFGFVKLVIRWLWTQSLDQIMTAPMVALYTKML